MTRWLASNALGAHTVSRAANVAGVARSVPGLVTRSLGVLLALIVAACGGGYPEPRNQLTASEAAVRAAEVAGAQNSPQSALHLKRAREQVEIGRNLIQEGENERAEWVLKRAQSDADLALAVASEETRRKQAAAAKEELDHLRDSVRQNGATP
jgi:hypothetical protein